VLPKGFDPSRSEPRDRLEIGNRGAGEPARMRRRRAAAKEGLTFLLLRALLHL